MENRFSTEYRRLLNDFEDYINHGYRQKRSGSSSEKADGAINESIEDIAAVVRTCTKCGLHSGRKNAVPGLGVPHPLVMIIGEGPGRDEDESGLPFVGKAGKYLDTWLKAVGLSRDENCFIANIVKCRPPNNRDPHPEEKFACLPYLYKQIDILKPKVILCVGRISAQVLYGSDDGIGALRKKQANIDSIPIVSTYHPSAVLRNENLKRPVWEDLKKLRSILDNV